MFPFSELESIITIKKVPVYWKAYSRLDVGPRALHLSCHLILSSTPGWRCFYLHFIDEAEAQRGEVTWPMVDSELYPGGSWPLGVENGGNLF